MSGRKPYYGGKPRARLSCLESHEREALVALDVLGEGEDSKGYLTAKQAEAALDAMGSLAAEILAARSKLGAECARVGIGRLAR